jgi:hypothetical protein
LTEKTVAFAIVTTPATIEIDLEDAWFEDMDAMYGVGRYLDDYAYEEFIRYIVADDSEQAEEADHEDPWLVDMVALYGEGWDDETDMRQR